MEESERKVWEIDEGEVRERRQSVGGGERLETGERRNREIAMGCHHSARVMDREGKARKRKEEKIIR